MASDGPVITAGMEELFNQDEFFNDVEVRIEVVQASSSATPQLRKTILASSAFLVGHSPRFKAELASWQPAAPPVSHAASNEHQKGKKRQKRGDAPAADTAASTSSTHTHRRIVHVSVEDEACVEAVEACLRFVYSGTLLPGLSVQQLIAIYRMADYLSLQGCTQAAAGALKALKPADLSVEDAVALGYGAMLPESACTAELKALCLAALLHRLGDVVVVMRSEALQALWLALPFPALLDLLNSEELATDSEDSVVVACSVWVERKADVERSNQPAASAQDGYISTAERQQLLDALRLVQLSSMYFHTVLPALRWAQPVLSLHTLLRLAAFAAAGDALAKGELQARGQALPAAWTSAVPRPGTRANGVGSAISVLQVTAATRQQLLDEALPQLRANVAAAQQQGKAADTAAVTKLLPAPEVFAHGVQASLSVELSIKEGLSVFVRASLPFKPLSLDTLTPTWRLRFRILGQKAGDGPDTFSQTSIWYDEGYSLGGGRGLRSWVQFPAGQPITEIASWDALALVDGQLRLKMEVQASAQRLLPAAAAVPAR